MDASQDGGAASRSLTVLAAYHVATGVLPLASRRAFEAITGRKREWWLVQSLGGIITTVGATVLAAGARRRMTPELEAIAGGCAASLIAVDLVYVARRRISPVYALDAALQAALLAGAVRERRRG